MSEKDLEARLGALEERFDEVFPSVDRRPFDDSTPPDVPCRTCAAIVADADAPVLRGKRWYCSATCADALDPPETA